MIGVERRLGAILLLPPHRELEPQLTPPLFHHVSNKSNWSSASTTVYSMWKKSAAKTSFGAPDEG